MAKKFLYTSDSGPQGCDQDFYAIFKEMIQECSKSKKSILIFIHGRGKHPQKAFKKKIITDLENNYNSKVIMLHWESWNGPFDFPAGNARGRYQNLISVLKDIQAYVAKNPEKMNAIHVNLLAHSMGTLMLEEAIKSRPNFCKDTIIDNIVLTASASALKNHSSWISSIEFARNIYVVMNTLDPMLMLASLKMRGKRLGVANLRRLKGDIQFANNTKYIDVSSSMLPHRLYLHRYLIWAPFVKRFFNQVFAGEPAYLGEGANVKKTILDRIYIFNRS